MPPTVFVSKPVKRADAVVLVHHRVARAQLGEARQRAAARAARGCGRRGGGAAGGARARSPASAAAPEKPSRSPACGEQHRRLARAAGLPSRNAACTRARL